MSESATRYLRLLVIQLVLVVAAVHLYWGLPKLYLYAQAGIYPDVRPPLFTLSGLLILGGFLALYYGAPKRPIYLAGALLMLGYFVGFVAWHLGGHGAFLPGTDGYGHVHGNPVANVIAHLIGDPVGCTRATHGVSCTPGDPLALVSKPAELGAAAILGYLFYDES